MARFSRSISTLPRGCSQQLLLGCFRSLNQPRSMSRHIAVVYRATFNAISRDKNYIYTGRLVNRDSPVYAGKTRHLGRRKERRRKRDYALAVMSGLRETNTGTSQACGALFVAFFHEQALRRPLGTASYLIEGNILSFSLISRKIES